MKDVFNRNNIKQCGELIRKQYPEFDQAGFYELATDDIDNRELKERGHQVYLGLKACLPDDYPKSLDILLSSLQPVSDNQEISDITTDSTGVAGWIILPYTEYVGEMGQAHLTRSLDALKQMTKRFSSEFGIRYFFLNQPQETLDYIAAWTNDPCHHVRRLVSEGCRPMLPWAMQLPEFKNNPSSIMPLLDRLKNDTSEYVRRSVANNLNDIAKHHPDLVAGTAFQWFDASNKNRQRLLKHACRTLIKQGHPKALEVFGYLLPEKIEVEISLSSKKITMDSELIIDCRLQNSGEKPLNLLMDYVVYHQKANGNLTPKVFKWKEFTLDVHERASFIKKHAIKPVSTRKYHSGEHGVAIQINGKELAREEFFLTV